MIKFWNCKWHKFGCMKEFETEKLEAHEEICLLRELDCPKVGCEDTFPFRGILDHYQEKHSNVKIKDEVLEFKGTIEDLKKSTFILNSYGKPFFPQFHVEDDDDDDDFDIRNASLYIWVFGHGDRAEIDLFEMSIKFFVNGKPKISLTCPVKSIDYDDEYDLCNGHGSMHFRGSTLFQYYDVQSNETQHQDFIEFQLKIVSEKLDEVKKDENVESGVEDSEKEEKWTFEWRPKFKVNSHSHVFESYAIYESQQKLPPFNKVQSLQSLTEPSKMFDEPFQAFIQRTSMDHSQ